MRVRALPLLLVLAVVGGWGGRAAAEDRQWPAWYVMPRVGTAVLLDTRLSGGLEVSRGGQDSGVTVGANLSRHFGIEVAGDAFETGLEMDGRGIGEYGLFTLLPQLRVRFPIEQWRLTPYAVAGLGVSFGQFNDRKTGGIGRQVRADNTALAASVGGGIDYALSRDVSVGVDVRYVTLGEHDIRVDGRGGDSRLDALLIGGTLRMLVDPNVPVDPPDAATAGGTRFLYLLARVGGATATRSRIASDVEAHPENAAIAGHLNLLFGVGLGADISRHLGFEIAADGHEYLLEVPGSGSAGEYAVYTVVPQVRVRYPLVDDRLVPYAVAGLGVSYAEFNDRKPPGLQSQLRGTDFAAVAAVGGGVEWFLSSNIAVGVDARYQHFVGHELSLDGDSRDSRPHAVLATLGFRIYFGFGSSW